MTGEKRNRLKQWTKLSERLRSEKGCCEKCGSKDHLCVHHILYKKIYPNLWFQEEDLIVLCKRCHFIAHRNPTYFHAWLFDTFPERWEWVKAYALKQT